MVRSAFGLLVAGAALGLPLQARALNITLDNTAPTIGAGDAYQTAMGYTPIWSQGDPQTGNANDTNSDQYRYVSYEFGAQGQIFSVPGTGLQTIQSITVHSFGGYLPGPTQNDPTVDQLVLRIGTIAGTTFTPISTETQYLPSGNGSSYFHLTLATPVPVVGGATYAFDLYVPNQGNRPYFGLDSQTADLSTGQGLVSTGSGGAYTITTDGDGTSFIYDTYSDPNGYNRYFDVAFATPEPAALGTLGTITLAGLLARRRSASIA